MDCSGQAIEPGEVDVAERQVRVGALRIGERVRVPDGAGEEELAGIPGDELETAIADVHRTA